MNPLDNNATPESQSLNIQEQLNLQQEALAKIYVSVEKTRKYIFWTTVANVLLFVLPLIVVAFAFPLIMNTFTSSLGAFTSESNSMGGNPTQNYSLEESLKNLQNLDF